MITNILTIDIEDWYHSSLELLGISNVRGRPIPPSNRVVINTERILHILREYNVKATCFVLGTVAEKFPETIIKIKNDGHEIATHGYGHELVYKLTPEQFFKDLEKSIELMENITGDKILGYRAPYFSITKRSSWALNILLDMGLQYDSSIFPIHRKLYGFSGWDRFPHIIKTNNGRELMEFPISTLSLLGQNIPIGGGGYFRMFPYFLIKSAIKRINARGKPTVIYLHPYELDTEELKYSLPNENLKLRFVRFTQNLNRSKTEKKLRALLSDFKFTTIKNILLSGGYRERR